MVGGCRRQPLDASEARAIIEISRRLRQTEVMSTLAAAANQRVGAVLSKRGGVSGRGMEAAAYQA